MKGAPGYSPTKPKPDRELQEAGIVTEGDADNKDSSTAEVEELVDEANSTDAAHARKIISPTLVPVDIKSQAFSVGLRKHQQRVQEAMRRVQKSHGGSKTVKSADQNFPLITVEDDDEEEEKKMSKEMAVTDSTESYLPRPVLDTFDRHGLYRFIDNLTWSNVGLQMALREHERLQWERARRQRGWDTLFFQPPPCKLREI